MSFHRTTAAPGGGFSWSYAAGDFQRMRNFGEIMFSLSDHAIRLGPLGDWPQGKVDAQVALTGLRLDPLVTVRASVVDGNARPILDAENRLADYRAVSIRPHTLVTGLYTLTVRAATAQGNLYYHRPPLRVVKPYDISVEGYPYEGKLWVTAHMAGLAEKPQGLIACSGPLPHESVPPAKPRTKVRSGGVGNSSSPGSGGGMVLGEC